MEKSQHHEWSVENVTIAALLLLARQEKIANGLTALSDQVAELIQGKVLKATNWGLQQRATGYYSQTIAEFLGATTLAGDVKDGNLFEKVELTESGVEFCQEIITSALKNGGSKEIIPILDALGIESKEEFIDLVYK